MLNHPLTAPEPPAEGALDPVHVAAARRQRAAELGGHQRDRHRPQQRERQDRRHHRRRTAGGDRDLEPERPAAHRKVREHREAHHAERVSSLARRRRARQERVELVLGVGGHICGMFIRDDVDVRRPDRRLLPIGASAGASRAHRHRGSWFATIVDGGLWMFPRFARHSGWWSVDVFAVRPHATPQRTGTPGTTGFLAPPCGFSPPRRSPPRRRPGRGPDSTRQRTNL